MSIEADLDLTADAPCRTATAVDLPVFIVNDIQRDQAERGLRYCARCPEETKAACLRLTQPSRTYYDGIAGGRVWREGRELDPASMPYDPMLATVILRAFAAEGWTARPIAERIGHGVDSILRITKGTVHAWLTDGVYEALSELWATLPTVPEGQIPAHTTMARSRAAAAGWQTRAELADEPIFDAQWCRDYVAVTDILLPQGDAAVQLEAVS